MFCVVIQLYEILKISFYNCLLIKKIDFDILTLKPILLTSLLVQVIVLQNP